MDLLAFGIPQWFTSSGIILELIFALVTLLIAVYSYKVYKIARQRYTFLFGAAFFSIGIAYFVQAALNFMIHRSVNSLDVFSMALPPAHCPTFQLSIIAVSLHVIFMIAGLALLAYVTLKERNFQIFALFLVLSFTGILFASHMVFVFYIISSIFLAFITLQHFKRHGKQGSVNSFLVFFSFGLIFLGNLQLAISMFLGLFYIIGHITVFVGYVLLLANLLRVVK